MEKTVTVTFKRTYEIRTSYQPEYDPSDGTAAGHYAWVGQPGDQSDFCVGPFSTAKEAIAGAEKRLAKMGKVMP